MLLFFIDSPSLLPIEGCSLSFVLQIHLPLERVFHLIPENAVLSGDDFVPGILEPQPDGNSLIMFYWKILKDLCHSLCILKSWAEFFLSSLFVICISLFHPQPFPLVAIWLLQLSFSIAVLISILIVVNYYYEVSLNLRIIFMNFVQCQNKMQLKTLCLITLTHWLPEFFRQKCIFRHFGDFYSGYEPN